MNWFIGSLRECDVNAPGERRAEDERAEVDGRLGGPRWCQGCSPQFTATTAPRKPPKMPKLDIPCPCCEGRISYVGTTAFEKPAGIDASLLCGECVEVAPAKVRRSMALGTLPCRRPCSQAAPSSAAVPALPRAAWHPCTCHPHSCLRPDLRQGSSAVCVADERGRD